jgi:hypothetical protein
VNRLTERSDTSEQVQTFILKDDFRVIRVFINGLLSRSNPTVEFLKQYGKRKRVSER